MVSKQKEGMPLLSGLSELRRQLERHRPDLISVLDPSLTHCVTLANHFSSDSFFLLLKEYIDLDHFWALLRAKFYVFMLIRC